MELVYSKIDAMRQYDKEAVKKKVVAMAKDGMLTEQDVMALTPLFLDDENARLHATAIVLYPSPAHRVALHNWLVARVLGEAFESHHGDAICTLMRPLFPPGEEFALLNQRLFAAANEVQGGGTADQPRLYACDKGKPERGNAFATTAQGGAPFFPVQSDGAGGYAVDMGDVATGYSAMQGKIAAQDQQIASLKRDLDRLRKAQTGAQQPAQANPNSSQANEHDARGRGRGGVPWYRRPAGGPRKPHGGDDDAAEPKDDKKPSNFSKV
jgi:hypothetical protein